MERFTLNSHQSQVNAKHPWLQSSRAKKVFHLTLFVPLMSGMFALFFVNTLPSPMTIDIALAMGTLLGILWMSFVIKGYRVGCYRGIKQPLFQKPWTLSFGAFFLGLMFGYSTFAWSVPWLVNLMIGTRTEQHVTVLGWKSAGARSCAHPDIGTKLFVLAPRALCTPSDGWKRMPAGTHLKLVGPASTFGINVDSVYIQR